MVRVGNFPSEPSDGSVSFGKDINVSTKNLTNKKTEDVFLRLVL